MVRVYVDSKIIDRHLADAKHQAFVGFVIEGHSGHTGFKEVEAEETDRAEEAAMLFAIQELTKPPASMKQFIVDCDHESAVLKANWKADHRKSKGDGILEALWIEKDANPGVRIEAHQVNPAHRFLNLKLKERESI
jgi:hypothetical protein